MMPMMNPRQLRPRPHLRYHPRAAAARRCGDARCAATARVDAGAAAVITLASRSVRCRDRFDTAGRVGLPTAAAGALPIEKPRSETAILARIAWQIFGALADQRAHQFEFAATRFFRDGLLRFEQARHSGQIRRLLHLRAGERMRRVGSTQRRDVLIGDVEQVVGRIDGPPRRSADPRRPARGRAPRTPSSAFSATSGR